MEPGADDEVVLCHGNATATIFPGAGGRLGQLDLGGGPLLRGPAVGLSWAHWGCYPLVPWSNRIPGGRLTVGDIDEQLPVNWDDGSAIHGLAASCPWQVRSQTAETADLDVVVRGGPFHVHGEQSFRLDDGGLSLRLAATNVGDRPVPMGIGIHPWIRYGPVRVAADERWPGEPLPTDAPVPVAGRYDLRSPVSPEHMDACFTALTEPAADVPGATLRWDGPVTNVVVYTGQPGWVCVEPVSMASNGFAPEMQQLGSGVPVVAPNESIEITYRFERAAPTGERD